MALNKMNIIFPSIFIINNKVITDFSNNFIADNWLFYLQYEARDLLTLTQYYLKRFSK